MPVHPGATSAGAPACADLQYDDEVEMLRSVRALRHAIDVADPAVHIHSEEVARYTAAVASRLGLDATQRAVLRYGSLLHDVGKLAISARILLKPARLTPAEFDVVKRHPGIGHRIVCRLPALGLVAPAILHHHERYDGAGYPARLAGEVIPLEARIISVADSFSAMTADRPYCRGLSLAEACAELERCAGTQFDPAIVEVFVRDVIDRAAA
jgi:HD-GYP domain-containing protein (c-di-GMP phosphodiesterase class II)